MGEVNLGHVRVISRSSSHVPHNAKNPSSQLQSWSRTSSLNEIQKMAGFNMWQPKYLPSNIKLARYQQILSRSSEEPLIIGTILKYRDDSSRWIAIEQSRLPETQDGKRQFFVPFPIWQESVNGRPTAVFTHIVEAKDQPRGQITITHYLWEHEGFLMELEGHGLSSSELVRIIESVG